MCSEYIAREVLQGKPYDKSIDWSLFLALCLPQRPPYPSPYASPHAPPYPRWTYGCLVYEMVHGSPPFRSLDMSHLVHLIMKCRLSFKPELCSPTLEKMLRGVMLVDGDARLTSDQLKAEPFFEATSWEALLRKEVPAPCVFSEIGSEGDNGSSAPVCHLPSKPCAGHGVMIGPWTVTNGPHHWTLTTGPSPPSHHWTLGPSTELARD